MLLPVTRKAVAFVVYEIVVVFKAFVQFQIVVLVVYVQRYFVIVGVNTRAGVIFTKLLLLKVVLFCSYFRFWSCLPRGSSTGLLGNGPKPDGNARKTETVESS